MAPAFSSTRQAAAFAFLLLVLMLLPALFTGSALPPREEIYSSAPWRMGAYPYTHQAIFEEKGDIDIAFIGASVMFLGIDTPYVQAALTKQLGRKATGITVAWDGTGYDALYSVAQDLLQNRKVHTLVFVDVPPGVKQPLMAAPYWFRFGDNAEAMRGMPLEYIPQYYFAAILGMPRNLLSLIRPNSSSFLYSPERLDFYHAPHPYYTANNPADRLGSLALEIDYQFARFVEYTPASHASPSDACIYSPATADHFHFSKEPMPPLQRHFAQKFGALANRRGTRLVQLTLPTIFQQADPFVQQGPFLPAILKSDVAMAGIPPAKLFSGIAAEDVPKLFAHDGVHLNKNGQAYFTRLITPALLKIYETQTNR